MHYMFKFLTTCVAVAAQALCQGTETVSLESVSGCAAVVSTTAICSTCMTIDCVVPATITAGCGSCPDTPPTIYRSFPCDQGCSNLGGCKTVYSVVTASDNECDGSSPTTPTASETTGSASDGNGSTRTRTQSETEVTALPSGTASNGSDEQVTATVSTAGAARLRPFRFW
ncbi:hypothetical protein C8A03DRAFT_38946 [Achaetomium macrosporum]|uniref:Uncharacterized protein n=1 Tax=Achaetomium macrosporum TaxID=79813 RepID=A0AAN7C1Z6_9PEZI|nr:hypothetical protein C8A03DRAFT_38946 [Achaetomium macrosporum]